MSKVKIKLVSVGSRPIHLNLKRIESWRSSVFELDGSIENFALRCDSDGYGWEFSDELLKRQLPEKFNADFMVAIVNVPIELNWYSRRLGDNKIVFTFHEIKEYLKAENIPLENAIFRVLYAYTLLYKRSGDKIPVITEGLGFTHDETRGCLFDMNGIKADLIESCDKPTICDECQERLKKEKVSSELIERTVREIKKIRKDLYYRALDFVKIRPLWALLISSFFAIIIGVLSSYAYDSLRSLGVAGQEAQKIINSATDLSKSNSTIANTMESEAPTASITGRSMGQ